MAAVGTRATRIKLPSDTEVAVTRAFDAPRALVFGAFTRPEQLMNWWGPRGFTTTVSEMDLRPGGTYRFVQQAPDGEIHRYKGVWCAIVSPEHLVFTQVYDVEHLSKHAAVVDNTFIELDGRTTLVQRLYFDSVEARDRMIDTGLENEAESFDRLDELFAGLWASVQELAIA